MAEKSNVWKVLAIIFIVLCVLETTLVVYWWNTGTQMIENENECVYDICGDAQYDAYYYDDYDEVCYCYTGDEITLTKHLGG